MGIDLGPEIRGSLGEVRGLASAYGVSERVMIRLILSGMANFSGAATAAETEAATSAGAALGGWAVLLVLVMVVAILELVAFLAHVLITPLSWIPLGIGPRISRWVYQHFTSQYDPVIAVMNAAAAALVVHMIHQWIQWIGWVARQAGFATVSQVTHIVTQAPSTGGSTSGTLRAQVNALGNVVTHLQQEIDSIEYQLDHPANGTQTAPQVWAEIHALQRSVRALNNAMISLRPEVNTLQDRQTALEHRMATLTSQLHGISAVAVTWQNIASEVDTLGNTVTNLANQTAQDLAHQERQITQLAPLGLLLQPGVKGLQTLRSLEDKPCQCPQFGNVPNWMGTALAVMEFVENG